MKHITLPTLLTTLRIALIPFVVLCFYLPITYSNILVTLVFSLAAITDWFDGYLARRLNQSSRFGAFLDPVADKLVVVVALVLLVELHGSIWVTIPACIIISREIFISALREWMAEHQKSDVVAVAYIGKIKTTLQLTAIITMLLFQPNTINFFMYFGIVTLHAAAVVTVFSLWHYIKAAKQQLLS